MNFIKQEAPSHKHRFVEPNALDMFEYFENSNIIITMNIFMINMFCRKLNFVENIYDTLISVHYYEYWDKVFYEF